MTEPAHYAYGPSSAARWLRCNASVEALAEYPDETSDAADEGTAAHWLAEQCLSLGMSAEEAAQKYSGVVLAAEEIGTIKQWPITGEMIEGVQLYLDTVGPGAGKKNTWAFYEERVRLDPYLGLDVPVGGTADTILYHPRSKLLQVFDLKYGRNHVVEVDDPEFCVNPQLGTYALGALMELKRLTGKDYEVKWIEVVIVQPRARHKKGPVRRKKVTPFQLMALELAIIEAVGHERVFQAGPHCEDTYCAHRPNCAAYAERRANTAVEGFSAEPAETNEVAVVEPEASPGLEQIIQLTQVPVKGLNLEQLGRARKLCKALQKWTKEVEEETRARLEHGLQVPGTKLVAGRGKREYGGTQENLDQAALETATQLGVAFEGLLAPCKLRSPADLEKEYGKDRFRATSLGQFVTYIEGKPTVDDADSDKDEYVQDHGFTAEVSESPLL